MTFPSVKMIAEEIALERMRQDAQITEIEDLARNTLAIRALQHSINRANEAYAEMAKARLRYDNLKMRVALGAWVALIVIAALAAALAWR